MPRKTEEPTMSIGMINVKVRLQDISGTGLG
jgi:hypothetical protein